MKKIKFFKLIIGGLSVVALALAIALPSAVLADSSNSGPGSQNSGPGSNNRGPRRAVQQVRRRQVGNNIRHNISPRRRLGANNNLRRNLADVLRQKGLAGNLITDRQFISGKGLKGLLDIRREDRQLDSSGQGIKIRRQGSTVLRRAF